MNRVAIIGCGTTKFTNSTCDRVESVLLRSVKNLFDDVPQIQRSDVDAVIVSNAAGGSNNNGRGGYTSSQDNQHNDGSRGVNGDHTSSDGNSCGRGDDDDDDDDDGKSDDRCSGKVRRGSGYLAPILSELAGIRPKAAHTVESLCSSGTNAIVSGYAYAASGLADVILVSGAEIKDSAGRILWWDDSRGQFKHPAFWASLFTKGYKRAYGATDDDLAVVPARAYANARSNPDALPGRQYTIREVAESKKITEDLRLLDCSRSCTGGASVLLVSETVSRKYTDTPIWITGIGQKTTSAGFTKNKGLSSIESAQIACRDALQMASSNRKSLDVGGVDVAEIHDAFSVCEPMILEALGIAGPGMGVDASKDLYETASHHINPRGGLIGSGHPLGATGTAQVAEVVRQLWSSAGNRQVDGATVGLVHNMSAAATSSTVLILER